MAIVNTLELSTAHLPESHPDFSFCSAYDTNYGWIVTPCHTDYVTSLPDWMQPIIKFAFDNNCSLIHFDRDADVDSNFQTYNW